MKNSRRASTRIEAAYAAAAGIESPAATANSPSGNVRSFLSASPRRHQEEPAV